MHHSDDSSQVYVLMCKHYNQHQITFKISTKLNASLTDHASSVVVMSTTFTCEEHVTDAGSTVKTQAHFAHAVSPTYLILRRKIRKTVFIANIVSKSPYSWRAQAHRGLLMSSELLSLPFQHLLWTSHCIRMFICDALWDRVMRASGRAEIIYLSLS